MEERFRKIFRVLGVPNRLEVFKFVGENPGATHVDVMAGLRKTSQMWRPLNSLCRVGLLRREEVEWKDVRYYVVPEAVTALADFFSSMPL